jgi:hypothetical protein
VRLGSPRLRHATPFPDTIINYIAGGVIESLSIPASLGLPYSPTFGPTLVLSPVSPLDSAHSESSQSVESLMTEPPSPSPCSSPDTAFPRATHTFEDGVDLVLHVPGPEQSVAKPASKLEQWWLDHRKGVTSAVKTVLEVASKVLDDIPAGGSTAAMVLDLGAKALEHVQVMSNVESDGVRLMLLGHSNPGRMWKPSVIWSRM